MKALVMRKPGELVLEERKKPVPKDDEALFKVLQVGVCGTDLHAFEGTQPFFTYPRVAGHELALEEGPAQFASWARPETRCLKAVVTAG